MKNIPYLISKNPPHHSLLVVTNSNEEAVYCTDLLRFWLSEWQIFHFCDWETLPYDQYSAAQELISQRLEVLSALPTAKHAVVIVSAATLRQRLCPQTHLDKYGCYLQRGANLSKKIFLQRLKNAGFQAVNFIRNKGEFSERGDYVDFFPLNATDPIHIEWENNKINELKTFDIHTATTKIQSKEIIILPRDEYPKQSNSVNQDYFLPQFFTKTATLFDYLPHQISTVFAADISDALHQHADFCAQRFSQSTQKNLLAPEKIWIPPDETLMRLKSYPLLTLKHSAETISFLGNAAERQKLWDSLISHGNCTIHASNSLTENAVISPLRHSFRSGDEIHLSASDLIPLQEQNASSTEALLQSLQDLHVGAPVIHKDFGVGRFGGLEMIDGDEMIKLNYADNAQLYIAVSDLNLLIKYSGNAETAPLHSLGAKQWKKLREKISRTANDTAAELLALYAAREKAEGIVIPECDMTAFTRLFPYQLTPDQISAIAAVNADLASQRPMDRLICGDVGFGKTEVALRAAFAATTAGFQVVLLAPTTLLAEQHEQKFAERFYPWAKIGSLSRFKTTKQQKILLEQLANGEINIAIGTHRLLQDDVNFQNLGLVIVDEEQRFGVKAKERLKELRHNVNLLTLSATPIPRTLNLALSGLRDLSIINTAPRGRQHIKTIKTVWDDTIIREACERELSRGGQIYFLHNDVETMPRIEHLLQKILPNMKIASAHGQMKERELEGIMRDFQEKRYDLLLSSTIIESGIDIPNANTILINRADKFGLGQLHQLRGRVGRGRQQAFAYLLIPEENLLTKDAQKRLDAFTQLSSLGAGFNLASQDLEIRGAGAILGVEQSGQIHDLGVAYYLDLLQNAIKKKTSPIENKIDLGLALSLNQQFIKNPAQRLNYYQKLAKAESLGELNHVTQAIIERYGEIPFDSMNLFNFHKLRIKAQALNLENIQRKNEEIILKINADAKINYDALLKLLQNEFQQYKLQGENILIIRLNGKSPLIVLDMFLHQINPYY